jgi:hypothetical protein
MGKLAHIAKSSFLASVIGSLLVPFGMLGYALFTDNSYSLGNILGSAAVVYFIASLNGSLLVFFIGSPVYLLLNKIKVANYFTSALVGGSFTMLFGRYDTYMVFLTTLGFIVGPLFHYFYTNKVAPSGSII